MKEEIKNEYSRVPCSAQGCLCEHNFNGLKELSDIVDKLAKNQLLLLESLSKAGNL